jgi:hypothetical protein
MNCPHCGISVLSNVTPSTEFGEQDVALFCCWNVKCLKLFSYEIVQMKVRPLTEEELEQVMNDPNWVAAIALQRRRFRQAAVIKIASMN